MTRIADTVVRGWQQDTVVPNRPPEEVANLAAMGFELISLFGEVQYRRWVDRPRKAIRLYIAVTGGWDALGTRFPTAEAAAAFALLELSNEAGAENARVTNPFL